MDAGDDDDDDGMLRRIFAVDAPKMAAEVCWNTSRRDLLEEDVQLHADGIISDNSIAFVDIFMILNRVCVHNVRNFLYSV